MVRNTKLADDVSIIEPVNIYGASIGEGTKIGPFVEIQSNVMVGKHCKISSHSFLCSGVTLGNDVFIGHGVMFTNDKYPRSTNPDGSMKGPTDYETLPTKVESGASIGSGATILPGITIGEGATVGAGAVVTKDVLSHTTVVGNPARPLTKTKGVQ